MTKGGEQPTGKQAALMRMMYYQPQADNNSDANSNTPEEGGWESENEVEVEGEEEEKEEEENKPPPKKKAKRIPKKLLADYNKAIDELLETGDRETFVQKFPPTKPKKSTSADNEVTKPKTAWLFYYDEKKDEFNDIPQTAVGLSRMIGECWKKEKNKSKWNKLANDDKNRYYDQMAAADPDFVRPKEKESPGPKAMYFQHLREVKDPRIEAVTESNDRKKMFFHMWNELPREEKNNWLVKCGTKRKRDEMEHDDEEE